MVGNQQGHRQADGRTDRRTDDDGETIGLPCSVFTVTVSV